MALMNSIFLTSGLISVYLGFCVVEEGAHRFGLRNLKGSRKRSILTSEVCKGLVNSS